MVLSIDLGATNIRIAEVNGDKIKNKKKVEGKLAIKKFCPKCKAHKNHKEGRK